MEHQYKDVSLPTGETKTITTTVEMLDFSAYEKLLDKYMEKAMKVKIWMTVVKRQLIVKLV